MITIAYNPDDLMVNAPFGANPHTSTAKWADLVLAAAQALDLDCRDVYEDADVETWAVNGFIKAIDYLALMDAVDDVTEGDWYDYTASVPDYEYMGG